MISQTIHQYLLKFHLLFLVIFVFSSCTSTLYVAPKQVDCTGVSAQQCYLIRRSAEGNWIMHYQEIQDLNYELGYSYKVKVKKENIKNVPMDGASFQYRVVKVVEKKDVTESIALEDLLDKEWKLEFLRWKGTQFGIEKAVPTINFKADAKISGNAGCNNYFGSFTLDGRTINASEIGSTRMICKEADELEQAFLAFLGVEMRGIFNDGKLVISADGGHKMIFKQ